MIRIEIVNDGTANVPENLATPPDSESFYILASYDYKVFSNDDLIYEGKIEDHLTLSGWGGIISLLDKQINGERYRE